MKYELRIALWLILFGLWSMPLKAQVVAPERLVDWSIAGFPDTIPKPSLIINVQDHGAVGDSLTENYPAIVDAINALGGRLGVIYFPAGIYLIGNQVMLPDSVIIRGESSGSTFLQFDLGGRDEHCFFIRHTPVDTFTRVISGFTKSSLSLEVTDGSLFEAGDHAEMLQENGSWDTKPATWAEQSIGQMLRITAVNGNSLSLQSPLKMDFDTAMNLEIRKIDPVRYVGLECLSMERMDTSLTGSAYNIHFLFATECWITGVESHRSNGSHILANASSHSTIRGCYIHDAFYYDGSGTRGYGVTLLHHTSDFLIEDNIFRHLRHAMMVKQGANGNVFAYNYAIEPNRVEFPTDAGADISLHGHFPFANLIEGNIVQNIVTDHYWGPSGPFNTFLRNRAELWGILIINLSLSAVITESQNYVGNEITSKGAIPGSYTMIGDHLFEHGNNDKGTIVPAGTATLPDSSYFLTHRPYYWKASEAWPSVGTPNNFDEGSIPARDRFLSGTDLTVCTYPTKDTSKPASLRTVTTHLPGQLFPNPFSTHVYWQAPNHDREVRIELFDLTNRLIYRDIRPIINAERLRIDIPSNLLPGLYILKTSSGNITNVNKVIKL